MSTNRVKMLDDIALVAMKSIMDSLGKNLSKNIMQTYNSDYEEGDSEKEWQSNMRDMADLMEFIAMRSYDMARNMLKERDEHTDGSFGQEYVTQLETVGKRGVDTFGFDIRFLNAAEKSGIVTVDDLCARTPAELSKLPGVGRTTLRNVRATLKSIGRSLVGDNCD